MSDTPHDFDELLSPNPMKGHSRAFRERVFQETADWLPRRTVALRWRPMLAWAASVLIAVAAGWALRTWSAEPPPIAKVEVPKDAKVVDEWKEAKPAINFTEPVNEPSLQVVAHREDPVSLEWKAFDARDKGERVKLLLAATREYIEQREDYLGAMRCLSQAIETGDPSVLEVRNSDSILVAALKVRMSFKEK